MKQLFLFLIVGSLFSCHIFCQNKTIVINEVMADNTDFIADESGKYEDWIEIYNYRENPVDIGGLYITDDVRIPKTFRIPPGNDSTIIPPKSFILLWADDEWIEFDLPTPGETNK